MTDDEPGDLATTAEEERLRRLGRKFFAEIAAVNAKEQADFEAWNHERRKSTHGGSDFDLLLRLRGRRMRWRGRRLRRLGRRR